MDETQVTFQEQLDAATADLAMRIFLSDAAAELAEQVGLDEFAVGEIEYV